MLRWLPIVLAGLWLGLVRVAAAAPGEVTITLEHRGQPEAPRWVCVVSSGRGPDQMPAGPPKDRAQPSPRPGEPPGAVSLVELLSSSPSGEVTPERLAAVQLDGLKASDATRDRISDALGLMADNVHEPRCGLQEDGRSHCAATVDPAALANRFVTCTDNEDKGASRQGRVLWLELSARDALGATASVQGLSLNGSVVTLSTNLKGSEAVKKVKSLGGHYVEGSETRTDGRAERTLQLETRCRWVPVRLPPIRVPPDIDRPSFVLEDDGRPSPMAPACVRGSIGDLSVEVRLPRNERSESAQNDRGMKLVAKIEQEVTLQAQGVIRRPLSPAEAEAKAAAKAKSLEEPDGASRWVVTEIAGERYDIDLGARWGGAWPAEPLPLRPSVLTFSWPRDDCYYPRGCPEARLSGANEKCTALERIDGCYYSCPVGETKVGIADEAMSVPVEISDDDHGDQRAEWGAVVDYLNQRFVRSVPPEQRRVRVDLDAWRNSLPDDVAERRQRRDAKPQRRVEKRAERGKTTALHRAPRQRRPPVEHPTIEPMVRAKGDRIDAVVLRVDDRESRRIELENPWGSEYYVAMPTSRCPEPMTVTVSIEGQRQYRDKEVEVKRGALRMPHPMDRARVLYFGTGVTGGFSHPNVLARELEQSTWSPALEIDLSVRVRFRRRARGWRFELPRFTYMMGLQPFLPLSATEGTPSDAVDRRLYGRFMLGALARTPELEIIRDAGLSVAFGLMGSLGGPLFARDIPYVGRVSPGLVPVVDFIARISRRLELRSSARFVCLETLHVHSTDLRGEARDQPKRGQLCSAFLGAGLAATW